MYGRRRVQGVLERRLGLLPLLRLAHELLRPGGQLGLEFGQPEVTQQADHEIEQRRQLLGQLLRGTEDVRVVLGEAARPCEAVHHPRLLEPVHGAELEQPQRQLPVRPPAGGVDQDVHGAVHRLRVIPGTLQLHRRVHAVGVPLQVP
jgi:hypothetical protein